MVIVVLEKCPLSLRGDLTKWLQEVSLGVYVGRVSARVRDELWKRICEECKSGRATMVFPARNEQHFDFRVHNTVWEPIDFDGVKLMMHPSSTRMKAREEKRAGWSHSAVQLKAQKRKKDSSFVEPDRYIVFDIETTGLDLDKDEIIEIAAIRVIQGSEVDRFHLLVRPKQRLSRKIVDLTGITDDLLESQGVDLETAMNEFVSYVGDDIVVAHNAPFDSEFMQASCEECDLDDFDNDCIDTIALAKKKMPEASNYRLETLLGLLNLDNKRFHRAESDCEATLHLFRKLIEM